MKFNGIILSSIKRLTQKCTIQFIDNSNIQIAPYGKSKRTTKEIKRSMQRSIKINISIEFIDFYNYTKTKA